MKMTNQRCGFFATALIAAAGWIFAPGCNTDSPNASSPGSAGSSSTASELRGDIAIDGSSTVAPISRAAAGDFGEEYPQVKVTVAISGTGGGFKRFVKGETDISNASRPIKKDEFDLCREAGVAFIELPVAYDAERLAAEISALGEDAWRPHPEGFKGNDFIPLIAVNGDPADEAFKGPMRPTDHLRKCPYLIDVLASLGAAWGRTRLMRLDAHADVTPHVDINYYWRDRMRVHVPIVTQPSVRFHCGEHAIHMGAGECWIFDTWSLHKVINANDTQRIHLVADTVGGEGFWNLVTAGRAVGFPAPPNWAPRHVAPGFVRSNPSTERQWESYGPEGQRRLIESTHTRRPGSAEDIANAVVFLTSDQASWITGQVLSVDGGRS